MIRYLCALCLMAFTSGNVLADTQPPLLFESDSVMYLTLPVNFDTLCRPTESPDCDYTPTELIYRNAAGQEASVPVSIRRRGGWRALQTNCQIPTLFVRFSEQDTAGTPFEGQTLLALNSHCGKGISSENIRSPRLPDDFERYVINEYLGYRLYNLVTRFTNLQNADMALLAEVPGLGGGDRRMVGAYLDSFFETLNSPEARERKIINACKPWPGSS
jgi:hypothetical protein